jgi:pimeloyl-ACP methyl ester carboxylesterase
MVPSPSPAANPAAAFYAGSRPARWLGAALRLIERVAPRLGTVGALRLFFTPLPWKLAMRAPLPAPWRAQQWPFEATTITVYRRAGVPAGRPRVLLVHGWAGSGGQMHRLAEALAAEGWDPVLLDFPAHGRSGGWRTTLPQFTRAMFAVTARLGPWHGIVAHSLGTIAAMHTAARGLPVERLVLVAPSAPPAQFLDWFAGSFGLPRSVSRRMRDQIERREAVDLVEFEPEWLGARLPLPCLVVHDRKDRVAPFGAGERVVAALPRAVLHATEGLGHRRVLDDAGVAARVVAHLAGETSGTSNDSGGSPSHRRLHAIA